jgi:2,4-dienoyl-CoA reductase-like NADH-dependent reductase (Old Yellow Enzyme family)
MSEDFSGSALLAPLVFPNGVEAKNRLWLAPMTNLQSADDGALSDDELRWLEMRARGGFGVIETCASHVARDGQGWKGELGIYDDGLLPGLERLATSLANEGVLGIAQIFHGGLRAPSSLTGMQPWSASAFSDGSSNLETPRAATEEDIARVIRQFAEAAARAHAAGFAGVELHGAHGYLLCQFLSRTVNTRTDTWGGGLEGRARLIREVTRAVRAVVPARFLVGVRLSPEDFGQARGLDLDESITTAQWLCEDGADFIHVSLWDASRSTRKYPDRHAVPLFREALPSSVPIVAAGSVWTRAEAESLLDKGASAVALGRAAIANPDWPSRIADAAWQPRRPPLTLAELHERGLNPTFASYMRGWKGFVVD